MEATSPVSCVHVVFAPQQRTSQVSSALTEPLGPATACSKRRVAFAPRRESCNAQGGVEEVGGGSQTLVRTHAGKDLLSSPGSPVVDLRGSGARARESLGEDAVLTPCTSQEPLSWVCSVPGPSSEVANLF